MQLKVVWSLSLQTGSEGPALISNAASRFPMFRVPRSWHTIVREADECARPPQPWLRFIAEPFVEHIVQEHVGQQWRRYSALRCAHLRKGQLSAFHYARLQPLIDQFPDYTIRDSSG